MRAQALALLGRSQKARDLLESALRLDAEHKRAATTKAPGGLVDRILATALTRKPKSNI